MAYLVVQTGCMVEWQKGKFSGDAAGGISIWMLGVLDVGDGIMGGDIIIPAIGDYGDSREALAEQNSMRCTTPYTGGQLAELSFYLLIALTLFSPSC